MQLPAHPGYWQLVVWPWGSGCWLPILFQKQSYPEQRAMLCVCLGGHLFVLGNRTNRKEISCPREISCLLKKPNWTREIRFFNNLWYKYKVKRCMLVCVCGRSYSKHHLTYLAGLSFPLWRAHTLEAVLQVDAGSSSSTWAGGTLVQIWGNTHAHTATHSLLIYNEVLNF